MDQAVEEGEQHGEQPRRLHSGWSRRWRAVSGPFKFLTDLRERFAKFSLELHPDKTRLIELEVSGSLCKRIHQSTGVTWKCLQEKEDS
jgi:hypothetical protein